MVATLATACSALQEPPQQTVAPTPKKASIVKTIPKSPALAQAPTTTVTPTPTTVVAPIVTTTTPPPSVSTPAPTDIVAAWTKVAVCEEGGWIGSSGPVYPNSLGINATNWYAYGGTSDTSISAQIAVGQAMVSALGMSIPDQNGCAPW